MHHFEQVSGPFGTRSEAVCFTCLTESHKSMFPCGRSQVKKKKTYMYVQCTMYKLLILKFEKKSQNNNYHLIVT